MKPLRFALAIPRRSGNAPAPKLRKCRSIASICAGEARLWNGSHGPGIDLGPRGHILGVLFSTRRGRPLARLPSHAPLDGSVKALARWLLDECWGAYIAVLADPAGGSLSAMVDPSGLLAVYCTRSETHTILVSHPADLEKASGSAPRVSWPAVRAHLLRPELRQQATCLEGVHELSPGALVSLGSDAPATLLWRPERFLPRHPAMTFGEAAEELRDRSTSVMGAWARTFGSCVVAASGGVDSSLICGALARSGASFACVSLATSDPSGDERRFAGLLATHLGVSFRPAVYDPVGIDLSRPASHGLPRPARKTFMAVVDRALAILARDLSAGVVLDGNGGDNLFCYLHSPAPVIDCLTAHGPGRNAYAAFLDMCRLTGCDVFTMARAVARRLVRSRGPGWAVDGRLLAAEGEECPVSPLRPWLEAEAGTQGGKRDHLVLLMQAQNHLHGIASQGLPRFSPLASQPVLEHCLAVPTWLWCAGGINRAPARAAFAAELPREILSRTSKAGPDSFIRRLFAENRAPLRELLLDGRLALAGLLDLPAVERGMSVDAVGNGALVHRLLDLAETEAWARSWSS